MGKLRTAWDFPRQDKIQFIFLFFMGALARVALLIFPFRWFVLLLGQRHENIPLSPLVASQQLHLAHRIGALTQLAVSYSPWQCQCLVQALMVKTLLVQFRIPYALYLGVAKSDPNDEDNRSRLKAHAWVVVGSRVICGGAECGGYTIVSTFVSPSILTGVLSKRPEGTHFLGSPTLSLAHLV